jgi:8-oxo-dGTP pyrophosphatase MutT (NUDIX family)
MQLVDSVDTEEWETLAREWGDAPRRHYTLDVAHPFLTGEHQMLVSDGRRAEICYIMHRGDPAEGVLLHIKAFYPDSAYRLPTGGIHNGEGVVATLRREIHEETGLTVGQAPDHVTVERFLGAVTYDFRHPTLGERTFATYHFLVRMPENGALNPQDATEQIAGWQWRPIVELSQVADRLADVRHTDSVWGDWGEFRALSHRFVVEEWMKQEKERGRR